VAGKVCADSTSGVHNPLPSRSTFFFSLRACELVSIAGVEERLSPERFLRRLKNARASPRLPKMTPWTSMRVLLD